MSNTDGPDGPPGWWTQPSFSAPPPTSGEPRAIVPDAIDRQPFGVSATNPPPPSPSQPPAPQPPAPQPAPPPPVSAPPAAYGPASTPHIGIAASAVPPRPTPNTAAVVISWVLTVLTLGYFLPWAVAATRGKSNQGAIAVFNLFLGWTLIGWIVAFVMACTAHETRGPVNVVVANVAAPGAGIPPGWYPSPDGFGVQYWDGLRWTGRRA